VKTVYITEMASFLPNEPVTNDQIETVLGEIPNQPKRVKLFVLQNNGIKQRYYAVNQETGERTHTNAQLVGEAVRSLVGKVGLTVDDIQGLACGSSSPDQLIPSHANMVAGELELQPAEVMSAAGVCCSGMSALNYAYMNLAMGIRDNFVVSGSERASPFMQGHSYTMVTDADANQTEAAPMVSFEKEFLRWMLSDGAGTALVETAPREDRLSLRIDNLEVMSWAGQKPTCMYNGMVKDKDGVFHFWSDEEDMRNILSKGYLLLQQDVRVLDKNIIEVAVAGCQLMKDKWGLDFDSVDYFLPHLSSMYFKKRLGEQMAEAGYGIPEEKWFTNLPETGNIGSASIFVILETLLHSGRLKKGDRILCAVPESARFSMAAMLLTVV